MNHQPFEEWLLNDVATTPEQRRELDLHLRSCSYCAALAETGKALSSAKMASPAPGFTVRFQERLVARKLAEHRRRFWGALLFVLTGLGLLTWTLGPSVISFAQSPASWITAVVEWLVFLATTFNAIFQAGSIVLRVVPEFVSPFAWMVIASGVAGIGLLWSVSIWRFFRMPRGV